ncbi:conserved oligomeric Golgi complex subunit 1 [Selaginella moellendorffii]|uniref:conserved oligomeric Golgi complex subunit 1 n=1 Tax=Selaginella moellendorffii TaxID=88036 RepID=UPI000D1C31E8|nr:conserved oligomeric Golgi complex subunit 1 [Selaginella moellendorffii]|eukprot:XP_024514890.1 conserved oligomeric Golgi complex subunit 1 [Selaginella moellendorffii]
MRGGRFERGGGGDGNARNAEALLESRSVAEVREVESATRKEIQDKQEELRQLVGASYRDLIDSADSILVMGDCCHRVMENLSGMAQGLDRLKESIKISSSSSSLAAVAVASISSSGSSREDLYGVGSRVKYLVDTPEKIWGCLDEHMYLEGAERFLRARQVHGLLLSSGGGGGGGDSSAATNFSLLWHHQWPVIETFQGQISARSRERLQEPGFAASDYAVALAAIAIVEDLSSAQVFSLFVETRKSWLRSYLRTKVVITSSSSLQDRVLVLNKTVDMIQLTLCHIGQLFLEVSNGTSPLLFTTILTAPPSSQLFGGIYNPEKEVRAWKLHREKLEARMVPLSGEFVAQGSLSFLGVCAQELLDDARPVLDGVSNGKDLAEMESSIRLHIEQQAALREGVEWLKSAFGQTISSPWEFLSALLLNSSVNLWETLFESMFLRRIKAIVDSRIEKITIMAVVERLLSSIDASSCLQQPNTGLLRSLVDDIGQPQTKGPTSREWLGEISLYFGPDVCRLKEEVDDGLNAILLDLLMFLGEPQSPTRILELAPYLHEKVLSCMSRICSELEVELKKLTLSFKDLGTANGLDSLVTLERALFLGRLSLALGTHLHYLPVIFGSPEQWITHHKRSSEMFSKESDLPEFRSSRRRATDGISSRLQTLQGSLRSQWDIAHNLWVSWSTGVLVKIFLKDLGMDDGLFATSFPKGWEETVLKQETDNAEGEIKISLPGMASPYAVSLLFLANQEIYRVGGHVLDKSVIHSFSATLLEKVLAAYEGYLSGSVQISERGSLQLLFDVRFLADVLVGIQDAAVKSKSQKAVKSLLSKLSSNLDPIDWATYEPQLWENERRCYHRCAVLFGFLTQLNRLYTDAALRNQPVTDGNTIGLSASVPRFITLPISMPLTGGNVGARTINGGAGGNQEGDISNAWKAYQQKEQGGNFTFDDSTGLSSLVNAPLLKSFMGQVGSRLGEGTLKFGSIIGDGQVGRLRDKSAAAISSTFGDMLPALSSLASGASKLEGYEAWRVP